MDLVQSRIVTDDIEQRLAAFYARLVRVSVVLNNYVMTPVVTTFDSMWITPGSMAVSEADLDRATFGVSPAADLAVSGSAAFTLQWPIPTWLMPMIGFGTKTKS